MHSSLKMVMAHRQRTHVSLVVSCALSCSAEIESKNRRRPRLTRACHSGCSTHPLRACEYASRPTLTGRSLAKGLENFFKVCMAWSTDSSLTVPDEAMRIDHRNRPRDLKRQPAAALAGTQLTIAYSSLQ